jgi:hypothetical protein
VIFLFFWSQKLISAWEDRKIKHRLFFFDLQLLENENPKERKLILNYFELLDTHIDLFEETLNFCPI